MEADGGKPLSLYSLQPGCSRHMTSWAILPGLWNSSVTQEEGVIRTHLGQPCPPAALARATSWPACFWYVAHTVSLVYKYFPCPPSHSPIWLYDLPINLPKYPSICLRCPEQAALACNKTPNWYNYWSITEQFLAVIKKMKGEAKIINYQVNLNHIQILFMFFQRWHGGSLVACESRGHEFKNWPCHLLCDLG